MYRFDYSFYISCYDEFLRGIERNRDKLKGFYFLRFEERSREVKRFRYDDIEKIYSMGGDYLSFILGIRNYR